MPRPQVSRTELRGKEKNEVINVLVIIHHVKVTHILSCFIKILIFQQHIAENKILVVKHAIEAQRAFLLS